MSISFAEVEQQACLLVPDERARLAEILLESLRNESVAEIETEWQHEIAQRVARYERGEVESFSAGQVFAEAKHIIR